LIVVMLVTALVLYRPATGQDNHEERIASLETRVSIVEGTVRVLRSTPIPPNNPTATPARQDEDVEKVEGEEPTSLGRIYRVIGTADVSEAFILDEGNHRLAITCTGQASAVFLTLESAPGEDVSVLETLVNGEEPRFEFTGTALARIRERARVVLVLETIGGSARCGVTVER